MAQVPILTFDIGAVGERVKNDKLGWVIEFNTNSNKILEKIKEISDNKEEYKEIIENFKKYTFKTIEEMQKYYDDLYKKIEVNNEPSSIYRFIEYRTKTVEKDFLQWQTLYGHVIHKYEKMRSTKLWKIAKKIKSKLKGK